MLETNHATNNKRLPHRHSPVYMCSAGLIDTLHAHLHSAAFSTIATWKLVNNSACRQKNLHSVPPNYIQCSSHSSNSRRPIKFVFVMRCSNYEFALNVKCNTIDSARTETPV